MRTRAELFYLKVSELKNELRQRGLRVGGKKEALVDRLYACLQEEGGAAPIEAAVDQDLLGLMNSISLASNLSNNPSTPFYPSSSSSFSSTRRSQTDVEPLFPHVKSNLNTSGDFQLPKPIADRVSRALNQRLYVIDTSWSEERTEQVFRIHGSKGDHYTVSIGRNLICNCMDAHNRGICKHILFVLIRVFRIPKNSPLLLKKGFSENEIREMVEMHNAQHHVGVQNYLSSSTETSRLPTGSPIFAAKYGLRHAVTLGDASSSSSSPSSAPPASCSSPTASSSPSSVVDPPLPAPSKAAAVVTDVNSNSPSQEAEQSASIGKGVRKPIDEDSECPICFEDLEESGEELVWCRATCGNNMHKDCIDMWSKKAGPVDCPMCRSPWLS
tara:strand:- start:1385 stop:2539 length:1155 start_codon:yes stop_codon:yes gene_type:complete